MKRKFRRTPGPLEENRGTFAYSVFKVGGLELVLEPPTYPIGVQGCYDRHLKGLAKDVLEHASRRCTLQTPQKDCFVGEGSRSKKGGSLKAP